MMRRFRKDESGMAMALAVIMIALLSVMGAGLLVFVNTDVNSMAETNRGQRAFEMADTGIKAGKAQLDEESDRRNYDGSEVGVPESEWAESKGGKDLAMDGGSVNVQIKSDEPSTGLFRVIATGEYGSAKRRIEAIVNISGLNIPDAYFSRSDIDFGGNANLSNASAFSMGDMSLTGSVTMADDVQDGQYFRWASPSYPNPFNSTPRAEDEIGLGVGGKLTLGNNANNAIGEYNGVRNYANSYSSGTTQPPSTAPRFYNDVDAHGAAGQQSNEITFPFGTSVEQDERDIEALRQRAIEQEAETGYNYYRNQNATGTEPISGGFTINTVDSSGNGSNNKGWPPNATEDTVVFYDYPSYSGSNRVTWSLNRGCPDETTQGILVINNGNFTMSGNNDFTGAIIIRSGTFEDEESFESTGSSCVAGYVNASGNIDMRGTADTNYVPRLSEMEVFNTAEIQSWRELYD